MRTDADLKANREWIRQLREIQKEMKSVDVREQTLVTLGLQKEWRDIQSSYVEFQSNLVKKVGRARDSLKAIQESIAGNHPVEITKSKIMQLESSLSSIKVYLSTDYCDREQEMKELLNFFASFKIEDYGSPKKSDDAALKAAQASKVAETFDKSLAIQSKIGKIDRQLAELGGRNGSWDPRDHDTFLKCLVQTFGNDYLKCLSSGGSNIIPKLLIALPNKNQVEIEEHIRMYILCCTVL